MLNYNIQRKQNRHVFNIAQKMVLQETLALQIYIIFLFF